MIMDTSTHATHSMQLVSTASCLFFLWIYKYFSPVISAWVAPEYTSLSRGKQIEWNTRICSVLHSVIVCSTSIYVILHEDAIANDLMWGNSTLAKINCAITVGYMSADSIVSIRHYQEIGSVIYLLHHSAIIYAYYYISTYGIFLWIACWRVLAELSAPFVNMRWFLATINYPKNKPLFVFTAVLMFLSYLVARIFVIPLHWHNLSQVVSQSFAHFGNCTYLFCMVCLLLDVLNVFWFTKIVKGAIKLIQLDESYDAYEKKDN